MARNDLSLAKNFDIAVINKWIGYNSANDKTNISPEIYVQGSLNMYKKLSGNIANRPGQKRIGAANSTASPVSSEFIWNTSWGATLPLWVTNDTLQVRYNGIWYTLLSGLTSTRYVFDKWWNETEQKDRVLFVHGTSDIQHWSGGIAQIASSTNNSGIAVISPTPTAPGSGYAVGDVLTITTGGTGATAEVLTLTNMAINAVSIQPGNGGTSYTVGDILVMGGVLFNGVAATVLVTSVDVSGVVTGVSLHTPGGSYIGNGVAINAGGGTGHGVAVSYTVTNSGVASVKTLTHGSGYTTGTGKATSGGLGTSATLNITAIATGTLTKTDSSISWQQAGFSTTSGERLININASQYTYTGGESTDTLYGITPDPTVEPANSIAFQSVLTATGKPATSGFNNDFIKVINNQAYVGSYTSRLCYISSNTDFTDYTVPTPRLPGSPELLTLDSTLNGIGVKSGSACISYGTSEWAVITFTNITVGTDLTQQTTVDVKPVAKLAAAYAHEFIGNSGDNIIYLSKDQQVRTFGNFNDAFVAAYPSLSQEISLELMAENFNGGSLKCVADFTYVTAPDSGKVYLYQVRQAVDANNQVVTERLWHSPFVWNATRIDDIDGTVVAFSNANPQVYQVWDTNQWHDDSPSDEPLPYSCVLALSYRSGRRQGILTFDKVFTEGYMTRGTSLNLTVNYDYQGSTASIIVPVNSIDRPTHFYGLSVGSLGDSSLGDKPLGDEIIDESVSVDLQNLPKFKNISSVSLTNMTEYQLIYSTDEADAQWEIISNGTNSRVDDDSPTFLINKIR